MKKEEKLWAEISSSCIFKEMEDQKEWFFSVCSERIMNLKQVLKQMYMYKYIFDTQPELDEVVRDSIYKEIRSIDWSFSPAGPDDYIPHRGIGEGVEECPCVHDDYGQLTYRRALQVMGLICLLGFDRDFVHELKLLRKFFPSSICNAFTYSGLLERDDEFILYDLEEMMLWRACVNVEFPGYESLFKLSGGQARYDVASSGYSESFLCLEAFYINYDPDDDLCYWGIDPVNQIFAIMHAFPKEFSNLLAVPQVFDGIQSELVRCLSEVKKDTLEYHFIGKIIKKITRS